MRTAQLLGLYWMFCNIAVVHGQDVTQRIEQYQVEAEAMNSPNCVFFDATLLQSNESERVLAQTRSVGRRVVGSKGEVRVDVWVTKTDLETDSATVRTEHLIRFGPTDYLQGVRLFGSALQIFDLEKSLKEGHEPIIPPGFNNPFLVAIGGENEFMNRSRGFTNVSAVEGLENTVKPSVDLKAGYIRTFKFSEATPWAITSWKSVFNPNRFKVGRSGQYGEDHLQTWANLKNPKQVVKDWNVAAVGTIDWTEVKNIGMVPTRILSQFVGISNVDESKTDFEVNYFGYNFDIKPIEKLLDRKRFNDANLKDDFPIELILEQAETAKKAIQHNATRKSGLR